MNYTEKLKEAGIAHLSYSAIKDLRNNEYIFKMHYIDKNFGDEIYLSSIIGTWCHYWINKFLQNAFEYSKEYEQKEYDLCVKQTINEAILFVFKKYITQNKKYDKYYSDIDAILKTYSYYLDDDLLAIVASYTSEEDKVKKIEAQTSIFRRIRQMDENLPDNIRWGVRWNMQTIIEWIVNWLCNWFNEVYPTLKDLTYYDSELEFTTSIKDKDNNPYDVPLKSVIDAIFKDNEWNYYIYDWKFKTALLNLEETDCEFHPPYDLQGTTYYIALKNYLNLTDKTKIFVRIFELTMSEPKPEYFLQKDLRAMCDKEWIDWFHWWANAKYMTNDQMTEHLVMRWVIKIKPCSLLYKVEPTERLYLLTIWHDLYSSSIQRLIEIFVENKGILPNFFDWNFDWWITIYKDYLKQFQW